jgi:hypothetical protein
MKKILILLLILMLFTSNGLSTKVFASENAKSFEFPNDSKHNQQKFGYYMLDFYHKEIFDAMRKRYKGVAIDGYNVPLWLKHNMVSITPIWVPKSESRESNPIDYSYAIKITLIPTKDGGKTQLGTDTIFFKVEPGRFHIKNVSQDLPPVKLVDYVHNPPPKKQ